MDCSRTLILIGAVGVVTACTSSSVEWPLPPYPEVEPNESTQEAMFLEEMRVLEGTIDACREPGIVDDYDVFFVEGHAGFVYRIEFETRDREFDPVVTVSDKYLTLRTIYPGGGHQVMVEVYEPFESPFYVMVSEAKRREGCLERWEEGRYWLRVTKRWACEIPAGEESLSTRTPVMLDFDQAPYGVRVVALEADTGMVGISLDSSRKTSDKKMVLVDCFTGEIIAGSDDRDTAAGITDPYLYEYIGGLHDLRLLVERTVEDLRKESLPGDGVNLLLRHHEIQEELEPNDRFIYANHFDPRGTKGVLGEERNIEGEWQADQDIFRTETTKGAVGSFRIAFEAAGTVTAAIFSSSPEEGGYSLFLLRRVSLTVEPGREYRIESYLPYTGTVYLLLQGTNISYSFSYEEDESFESIPSIGSRSFSLNQCTNGYATWSFPPFVNAVRFSLSSSQPVPVWRIFDENNKPMFHFESPPEEREQVVYLTRLSGQSRLLFEVMAADCTAPEGGATLTISGVPFVTEVVTVTESGFVGEIVPDTTYIGWIDTDVPIIENRWHFVPDRDGVLTLLTTPVWEWDPAMLDSVLRLYEEGKPAPIAENDDIIEWLSFHNESFLSVPVTGGKRYEVSVMPFMDASSTISAMNIHLHYGLDVRFDSLTNAR